MSSWPSWGLERQERLNNALKVLGECDGDFEKLKRKIAASRTTWLVAGLVDGISQRHETPPSPPEFTVIATDGSQIDVDRHQSTRCCLINLGSVTLNYGANPGAILESQPHLYSGEEELVIAPTDGKGREQPIEGGLLGIKRGVDECHRLTELAATQPPGSLTLALLDGTLILWGLEAYPDFVTEALLNNGFLRCLNEMRNLNGDRQIALASYISFPRSTDVVNALRVAICPHEPADCDRHCPSVKERGCAAVSGVRDRELFLGLLENGERSALFTSPSQIVTKRYGEHQIHFFYLNVDDEIARVEVPRWVATDRELLDLVHCLVLDQCRRGHGYPVALSEAHEKAVVTGADREYFWQLVEASLVDAQLPSLTSAKSRSKKTRWV
ncbi:DNA double-strand break repair nuclease NurA [Chloroflexota bacterium]